MNYKVIIAATTLFISGTMISCEKKYEDGPPVSLTSRTDRMANTWVFSYAKEDGENVSDQYDQYELYLNTSNEAKLEASYTSFGVTFNTTTEGVWSFTQEEDNVLFNFDDNSFDDEFRILRLMKEELWLKDLDEDLELHLLSK